MAEEESDESSFKLRRWQRRNLIESASSFVHGWSSSMVRGADWIEHSQWLRRGEKSTGQEELGVLDGLVGLSAFLSELEKNRFSSF
ncbi:hypothetical protein TorRG33x02_318620 [Trema orientale]|uniref:Uncharacterized protein n=1 Tax=Trema orientale TaxID=63057 RepID=A0A2P5BK10_TREOI|nr:hypothetical protein TorRG33x02_318620 [Trema orientale]